MGDYAQEAPLMAGALARGELTAVSSCLKTGSSSHQASVDSV